MLEPAADALDARPVTPTNAAQAVIKTRDFRFSISVSLLWLPPIKGRECANSLPVRRTRFPHDRPALHPHSTGAVCKCANKAAIEQGGLAAERAAQMPHREVQLGVGPRSRDDD